MSVQTARFNTIGLHCHSCVRLVEMSVGELEGVVETHTDLESGVTQTTFDAEKVTPADIIATIRGAGYDAALID